MVAIKGMEMPKSCALCPMTYKDEVDYHICALIGANIDYLDKNEIHPDCPLKEIVTCKDCKCKCTESNGQKFSETRPDFFCADGERRR